MNGVVRFLTIFCVLAEIRGQEIRCEEVLGPCRRLLGVASVLLVILLLVISHRQSHSTTLASRHRAHLET